MNQPMAPLDQFASNLLQHLEGALPGITVGEYPLYKKGHPVPACLLQLPAIEGPDEGGVTDIEMNLRWRLHCLVRSYDAELETPAGTPTASQQNEAQQKAVRNLALGAALGIKQAAAECLPECLGAPEIESIAPDEFQPEIQGYFVWYIDFTQIFRWGQSYWRETGEAPKVVMVGLDPETGLGNEHKYQRIAPTAE